MRPRFLMAVLILSVMLCGCSIYDGQYSRVTPHKMQSNEPHAQAYTAENYMQLREVLADMAASGVPGGIIYTDSYAFDDLEEIMLLAKKYLCEMDPLGAYAVQDLSYQVGTNSGKTAVAVEFQYQHSLPELQKVFRVEDVPGAEQIVLNALSSCDARVAILIGNYQETDFTQMVWDLAQINPQTVMEIPQISETKFGQGERRLVELVFSYENSRDSLRSMQNQVRPIFDAAALYVTGDGSENQKFSQLYAFLMERFDYKQETSITPAYSLLRHGVGDSRAFATVYAAMCREAGLDCQTITGTRMGESWTWNLIRDDGKYYHVDLLKCSAYGGFRENLDAAMSGYVWDYSAYPVCDDVPAEAEQNESDRTE